MPFPALLALTSLLAPPPFPAAILVAGDHRQLPCINAHDFATEARLSIVAMKTHLSAYDYLHELSKGEEAGEKVHEANSNGGPIFPSTRPHPFLP